MTDLKPCPICGRKLTWGDVTYIDDEGYETISEECCERVILSCESSCGFIMQIYADDIDFPFGEWRKEFLSHVNKRACDGGMKNDRS